MLFLFKDKYPDFYSNRQLSIFSTFDITLLFFYQIPEAQKFTTTNTREPIMTKKDSLLMGSNSVIRLIFERRSEERRVGKEC